MRLGFATRHSLQVLRLPNNQAYLCECNYRQQVTQSIQAISISLYLSAPVELRTTLSSNHAHESVVVVVSSDTRSCLIKHVVVTNRINVDVHRESETACKRSGALYA